MQNKSKEQAVILAVSGILFIWGQFLLMANSDYITGGIITLVSLGIVAVFYTGLYGRLKTIVLEYSKKLSGIKTEINAEVKPEKKDLKIIKTPAAVAVKQQKFTDNSVTAPVNTAIGIDFDKKWILAAAGLFFVLAQAALVVQKFIPSAGLIAASGFMLIYFFINKDKRITLNLEFKNSTAIIMAAAGGSLMLLGWLLLINRANNIQNIGVAVTTAGIILLFFGLPENAMAKEPASDEQEVLFKDNKFLNNYWVKGALLVFVFIMVSIGNKIAPDTTIGLYSMAFYAAAITAFFFAMPVINFYEIKHNNKLIDILKLAGIIAALILAYFGQKAFTANRIGDGLTRYLIASAIIITAFPVSLKKEQKESMPLKVEYFFVAFVTLLAFFLRIYELDKRPFGLENDESGAMVSVVKNFWVGQHPIYAYVWELSYKLFGLTREGLRMSGVMIGTLSVPIMYFAIRSIFNVRTAMFAAVAFAFLRWNLHFGRSGHGTIMAVVATTLTVYFIFKAIEKRNKFTYFMAGMMSGLCWYGVLTGWFVVLAPLLYILMESFTKKEYFKRNMIGVLAFLIGFWVFGSHHIKNYFISTKTYFGRISEVSVFSQDPNAPTKNPAIGILENTQRVLLMFNHHGDSRQRNSGGQPYEPTVDFVTAMLFGLGFFYCIYYSKFHAFFILVMIFFSQAAGSIFAIEAPSAMRAVGTMIPMMFFAALIFDKTWTAFSSVFNRKISDFVIYPLMIAVFLVPISMENYRQYFKRWVGGMDELATAAGMYSKKLGNDYRIFLYTGLYYPGHPPYRIFRWDYKVDSSSSPTDAFYLMTKIEEENYAIFFHYDVWQTRYYWQQLFPEAQLDSYSHAGFGKFFDVLLINKQSIDRIRGLVKTTNVNPGVIYKNQIPVIGKEENFVGNSVYKGKVFIPYYSACSFSNTGTANADFVINGFKLGSAGEIKLAKGFNNITIRVNSDEPGSTLYPVMKCSRYTGNSKGFQEVYPLNDRNLYSIPDSGLMFTVYSGDKWKGFPISSQEIIPVPFLNRFIGNALAARFSGYYNAGAEGVYKFNVSTNGFCAILIDGLQYWDNMSGLTINENIYSPGMKKVNDFKLTKGKHKIDIFIYNSSQFFMQSSFNNGEFKDIDFDALTPELFSAELK